jgi:dynactin-5
MLASSIEEEVIELDPEEFTVTSTGNIVSRKSELHASTKIRVHPKCFIDHGAILRGDLADISIGRNCVIGKNVELQPCQRVFKGELTYFPLRTGDFVHIGDHSIVKALVIGSAVDIGPNVVIGPNCILSDCCRIEAGSVLAPSTVVPPFTVYAGRPAHFYDELPECWKEWHTTNLTKHLSIYKTRTKSNC